MNLQIAKWGNSLALRIPAEYVRNLGVKEGDTVEVLMHVDGGLSVRPVKWDRKSFVSELKQFHESMPEGESVINELRRGERY